MKNISSILQSDLLVKLIQDENFVGWVYSIDYDTALIMTNDLWKANALGIPHNCFLLAASFNPNDFVSVPMEEREVILLRVISSARLPQDDDLVRTKIDHFQQQTEIHSNTVEREYDDITRNQMQFGGLKCRVLGTFYTLEGELWLGSDLESFATAAHLNVYRPRGASLHTIVNHIDPVRRKNSFEEAQQLGIQNPIQPFQIGTVRYTSTDRLHRRDAVEKVPVCIQPSDFLARRTAVLGMTRTGKSNMIKQMVAVVKRVADEGEVKVGQIIYDINGEYANANRQDKGAIADVYPTETICYRMLNTPNFKDLRNNFYDQLIQGFAIIKRELEEANRVNTDYIRSFVNMSLDEPDPKEQNEYKRWQVRVAAYKVLLDKAGFHPPSNLKVVFTANKEVQGAVNKVLSEARQKMRTEADQQIGITVLDPARGLSLQQASDWFEALRIANAFDPNKPLPSSSGKPWVDDTLQNLLDMIMQKSKGTNNYISGYRVLAEAVKYHSPLRSGEVAEEIYKYLSDGKIIILDLSVGDSTMREKVSKQIAAKIFQNSMQQFIEGRISS